MSQFSTGVASLLQRPPKWRQRIYLSAESFLRRPCLYNATPIMLPPPFVPLARSRKGRGSLAESERRIPCINGLSDNNVAAASGQYMTRQKSPSVYRLLETERYAAISEVLSPPGGRIETADGNSFFLEAAEAAVCGGVALRGLCAERFEPGTKKADERVSGGRTGRGLALHSGFEPDNGGQFGGGIQRKRIPEGSEPGEHRAQAGARGGAAMVGATEKMVFVREVKIPEHAVEEFRAVVGVEEVPVTGLKVNGQAGFSKLLRIRASPVGRSVFGRASLTLNVRPSRSVPFRALIAFTASASFVIATNPKPRGRPDSR